MICSPVNLHRQTEAERVEVIAVCITRILPLIEQWPHVCRYSVQCYIRYAVFNGTGMVLPTKLWNMSLFTLKAEITENGSSNHIQLCSFAQKQGYKYMISGRNCFAEYVLISLIFFYHKGLFSLSNTGEVTFYDCISERKEFN